MTNLQKYKNLINRLSTIISELDPLIEDVYNVAGENIERYEDIEIRNAINAFHKFLYIREATLENETEESFENFKKDPYFGHNKEMREYFKLSNIDHILASIPINTLAAKSYMFEQGISNIGNIESEIQNLEDHAHKVIDNIKDEINKRDPYYDPNYDEE